MLPRAPIDRLVRPLAHFLHVEAASGVVLLVCTAAALALANSPWADGFAACWQVPVRIGIGSWELNKPLLLWINDGLMTVFFFVVGLEIKREVVAGELHDPRAAALPIMAALGGMVVPALIYFSLQRGQPGEAGWGIPMATDIAFVVGFLALLGPRVPLGLKILLLSLAIADDIGAVLVIAVFYSANLAVPLLGLAALGFVLVIVLNRLGVRSVPIYTLVGAAIWLCVLKSGVHPTVAGVLLGLFTPAGMWVGDQVLADVTENARARLQTQERSEALGQLAWAAREALSPLERLERALHPWVAFAIMPLFALANAGVAVEPTALAHPVAVAVALGLALGKPLGIVLFSATAVRLGFARLPTGVTWPILLGGSCLAGIGFTMSLFIASLALDGDLLTAAKIGTLTGSLVSAVLGCGLLVAWLTANGTSGTPAS